MNKGLVFLLAAGAGWFFLLRPKPASAGGVLNGAGGDVWVSPDQVPRAPTAAGAPIHTAPWLLNPEHYYGTEDPFEFVAV